MEAGQPGRGLAVGALDSVYDLQEGAGCGRRIQFNNSINLQYNVSLNYSFVKSKGIGKSTIRFTL